LTKPTDEGTRGPHGSRPPSGNAAKPALGALLWRASLLYVDRTLAELAAEGFRDVTRAHMKIFPVLNRNGSRITDLATRLGITKQAVAKLIDDLESLGYMRRAADDGDGRAKKILLTDRGKALLFAGAAARERIESDVIAALPAEQRAAVHATLDTIAGALARSPDPKND
jgi:DNA-binding MarR family transcriptional regulator